jgi:hypothetical protein
MQIVDTLTSKVKSAKLQLKETVLSKSRAWYYFKMLMESEYVKITFTDGSIGSSHAFKRSLLLPKR